MLFLLILYALFAIAFTIAKYALFYAQPIFLIGFRMIIAGSFLLLYRHWRYGSVDKIARSDWPLLIKTTFFHIYCAYIFEFWALQYVSSIKTIFLYSITPFISAIIAAIRKEEAFGSRKIIGIIIGFLSVLPIIYQHLSPVEYGRELFYLSLPEVILFMAITSSAYAWFLIKDLTIYRKYHMTTINGITMFFGGFCALVTSAITEMVWPLYQGTYLPIVEQWVPFLQWTLLLILIANLICYNLYAWLLRSYSATFISLVGFLCPLFGTCFGWYFLYETISWHYILSFFLIVIALFLFHYDTRKMLHKKKGRP